MNCLVFIITNLILIGITRCHDFFTYPIEDSNYCLTPNGSRGLCALASQCPEAFVDFQTKKIQPILCYFLRHEPVICCALKKSSESAIGTSTSEKPITDFRIVGRQRFQSVESNATCIFC